MTSSAVFQKAAWLNMGLRDQLRPDDIPTQIGSSLLFRAGIQLMRKHALSESCQSTLCVWRRGGVSAPCPSVDWVMLPA